MSRNQYSLVNHTILPLIYRLLHPEIQQISKVHKRFIRSLFDQRS